jgi:hypothetical protein
LVTSTVAKQTATAPAGLGTFCVGAGILFR